MLESILLLKHVGKYGDILGQSFSMFFVQGQEAGTKSYMGKSTLNHPRYVVSFRVFARSMNICHKEFQFFGVEKYPVHHFLQSSLSTLGKWYEYL